MNDKIRDEFEAWHRGVVAGDPPHEKYNSGDYRNQHVQRYWFGWQASREALVIELPSDTCIKVNNYTPFEMRDFFERSARRLGLKVTP
ncbi:hypothetical protein [Pseudomonas sp. TMB3-21]